MDIYEEYSEEDIQTIKEYINMTLNEYGIEETMKLLKNAKDMKRFLERYDEDRKRENEKIEFSDDEKQDDLVKKLVKAFTGPRTKKMSEEQENALRLQEKELKKLWDVTANDQEIQDDIASALNSIQYDEDDIESRMKAVKNVLSVLRTIPYSVDENGNFNRIYEAISPILRKMNFNDFTLTYVSAGIKNFFENPIFKDVIINKIEKANNQEFIYLMQTTCDGMDGNVKEIVEVKKKKIEQCNDVVVTEVADANYINADVEHGAYDPVLALFRQNEGVKKFELYSKLSCSDFMRYMIMYMNIYGTPDSELLKSDTTSKIMKQLSKKDIITLVEIYYNDYMDYIKYKDDKDVGDIFANNVAYKFIIDEAQARGLISQDLKKTYGDADKQHVNETIYIYKSIAEKRHIPCEYINFKSEIDENDEDIDDRDSDEILLDRFENANKKIDSLLEIYKLIGDLEKLSDITMLQEVNRYNLKFQKGEKTNRKTDYMISYFKKKILGFPISYASFFQMIDEGLLNDAMQIKVSELQNTINSHEMIKEE